jgi:hypothetical protein
MKDYDFGAIASRSKMAMKSWKVKNNVLEVEFVRI